MFSFYTKRKEVIFKVESFEVENNELFLKDGIIKFIYNDEDNGFTLNTNDIQKIIFEFTTTIKTKIEPYYVNNFIIDMNEKIIYTYNKNTFKLIKLGEMKEFKSFQEAINIIENFMEEISIKE